MKRMQASMRDRAASKWRESKLYYRVGSPMKGCDHCGEIGYSKKGKEIFISGYNVFRSYKPWAIGWTWKCMDCNSVDLNAWADDVTGINSSQLGKEPQRGMRSYLNLAKEGSAIGDREYKLRKELMGISAPKVKEQPLDVHRREPAIDAKIKAIEDKMRAILEQLAKGAK